MFNAIKMNLDKFKYERHCSFIHYYIYKDIKIEISNAGLFARHSIFINDEKVIINYFEKRKLNNIIKQLEKMKNNNNKKSIIDQVTS